MSKYVPKSTAASLLLSDSATAPTRTIELSGEPPTCTISVSLTLPLMTARPTRERKSCTNPTPCSFRLFEAARRLEEATGLIPHPVPRPETSVWHVAAIPAVCLPVYS